MCVVFGPTLKKQKGKEKKEKREKKHVARAAAALPQEQEKRRERKSGKRNGNNFSHCVRMYRYRYCGSITKTIASLDTILLLCCCTRYMLDASSFFALFVVYARRRPGRRYRLLYVVRRTCLSYGRHLFSSSCTACMYNLLLLLLYILPAVTQLTFNALVAGRFYGCRLR